MSSDSDGFNGIYTGDGIGTSTVEDFQDAHKPRGQKK